MQPFLLPQSFLTIRFISAREEGRRRTRIIETITHPTCHRGVSPTETHDGVNYDIWITSSFTACRWADAKVPGEQIEEVLITQSLSLGSDFLFTFLGNLLVTIDTVCQVLLANQLPVLGGVASLRFPIKANDNISNIQMDNATNMQHVLNSTKPKIEMDFSPN